MKTKLLKALDASKDCNEIKEILRSEPSQMFSYDNHGKSPLHKAVEQGKYEVVDYLMVWGASPNIKDRMGHTPLHLAIIHKHFKIAKLLIAGNAFVNSVSETGKTPLHFLTDHQEDEESIELAKFMLQQGAYPRKQDRNKITPILLAEKTNKFLFLELLKKY